MSKNKSKNKKLSPRERYLRKSTKLQREVEAAGDRLEAQYADRVQNGFTPRVFGIDGWIYSVEKKKPTEKTLSYVRSRLNDTEHANDPVIQAFYDNIVDAPIYRVSLDLADPMQVIILVDMFKERFGVDPQPPKEARSKNPPIPRKFSQQDAEIMFNYIVACIYAAGCTQARNRGEEQNVRNVTSSAVHELTLDDCLNRLHHAVQKEIIDEVRKTAKDLLT